MGGIGLREVVIVLIVGIPLAGIVALLFPRKWVPLKVKYVILGVWVVLGIVQIVYGVSYGRRGASAALDGFSEVLIFGGGFLTLAEKRWMLVIGWAVIFMGLVFMTAAATLKAPS